MPEDLDRLQSDDGADIDWYRAELEASRMLAWGVYAGAERVGVVLMRAEGREVVIVAAQARVPGGRGMSHVLPVIEAFCRDRGATSIRIHTTKPGVVRMFNRAGYRVSETVMRKAL
ncbi:hypothetical protein [Oceanibaculum indicum]|nr:hypothetical protein [Oceanibaculum indicum]